MRILMAGTVSALALCVATGAVQAGGFAVREQSASSQGSSFAGSAAGFDLSSMYWNPAAVTVKDGMNSESHATVIFGQSELTAIDGTLLGGEESTKSGNIADPALVASSYANYSIGNLYLGLSLTAPFGLTTKPENNWDGRSLGFTSKLLTINASPTVGYRIAPGVSVAAGVQIQYVDARLTSLTGTVGGPGAVNVDADDIGFGFTAGILLEPSSGTKIGLGFRSSVSHELEGSESNAVGSTGIKADVDLPEIVTASLRQDITHNFRLLGTVEWTNWSRVDVVEIVCKGTDGAACPNPGEVLSSLELNYDDGWFFALGAEYQHSPTVLLRTGLAYEISPARKDTSRTVRLADNDRIWASIGATIQYSQNIAIDLGYTHIFVEDGKIDQESGVLTLIADVDSSVDIVSGSVKFKW